jgi:5-formyltetrahydrofolate cyclo-ligase
VTDKPHLRRTFRAARRAMAESLAGPARLALAQALARWAAPACAGQMPVASYVPYDGEMDPGPLAAMLSAQPLYPRIIRSETIALDFAAPLRDADWTVGRHGIRAPASHLPAQTPQLILVPLLAVTPLGVRLGQGAGDYDRTLAQLPDALCVGIAWDGQLIDDLPSDPWDKRLDAIATPSRWIPITWR